MRSRARDPAALRSGPECRAGTAGRAPGRALLTGAGAAALRGPRTRSRPLSASYTRDHAAVGLPGRTRAGSARRCRHTARSLGHSSLAPVALAPGSLRPSWHERAPPPTPRRTANPASELCGRDTGPRQAPRAVAARPPRRWLCSGVTARPSVSDARPGTAMSQNGYDVMLPGARALATPPPTPCAGRVTGRAGAGGPGTTSTGLSPRTAGMSAACALRGSGGVPGPHATRQQHPPPTAGAKTISRCRHVSGREPLGSRVGSGQRPHRPLGTWGLRPTARPGR